MPAGPLNKINKNKFFQACYFGCFKAGNILFSDFRKPLLAGIKLTNICNLKCMHCPFWRSKTKQSISWSELNLILRKLYEDGARIAIFEGGEPLLWKDAGTGKDIHDAVALSKKYFFSTAVTTNGTLDFSGIKSDIVFISLDGLEDAHNKIRGNVFNIIIENIRKYKGTGKIIVNLTISKLNLEDVVLLIKFLQGMVYGITVQFFYPYEGIENLSLDEKEKEHVINNILELKKDGYKILDSATALERMKKNNWKCEDYLVASVDPDGKISYGCYLKNRAKDISCKNCGFLAHCELSLSFQMNIDALRAAKNIFWNKATLPAQEKIF